MTSNPSLDTITYISPAPERGGSRFPSGDTEWLPPRSPEGSARSYVPIPDGCSVPSACAICVFPIGTFRAAPPVSTRSLVELRCLQNLVAPSNRRWFSWITFAVSAADVSHMDESVCRTNRTATGSVGVPAVVV